MAEPILYNDCKVWLGGYDFSGDSNRARLTVGAAELPNGRFGDVGEVFYPGLFQVECEVSGFWYSAATGSGSIDEIASLRVAGTPDRTEWPITLCPVTGTGAAGADGNTAFSFRSAQFAYNPISGNHGELLPFTLTSRMRAGNFYKQTVILPKATYAATATGTATQLGAVAATQKLVTVLHVFAVTGGTWTLTIESDNGAGFGTPTTVQTFTGATGITRQVIETNGAITDDYFRAVLTKSGGTSCVAAVTCSVAQI